MTSSYAGSGVRYRLVHREHLVESGEFEELADLWVEVGHGELASAHGEGLGRADEGADPDAGDEVDAAHIDDERFAVVFARDFHGRSVEVVGAGLIEPAGKNEHGNAVLVSARYFHQDALAAATAASRVSCTA